MALLRRQLCHLRALPPMQPFAFVRESCTGMAMIQRGVVIGWSTEGGVAVEVRVPGERHRQRTVWSGYIYVMPLDALDS